MDLLVSVLTPVIAFLAAVVGGWVGSATQFSAQRRLRSLDLVWDFRLQLHRLRECMWDEGSFRTQQERAHWLGVAASDPRVSLDPGEVEAFVKAVETAYGNLLERLEISGGRESDIEGVLVEKVNATMRNLDDLAIRRLKKLH